MKRITNQCEIDDCGNVIYRLRRVVGDGDRRIEIGLNVMVSPLRWACRFTRWTVARELREARRQLADAVRGAQWNG